MNSRLKTLGLHTGDKRMLRAGVWDVPEGAGRRGVCVLLQGLAEFLEKYDEVAGELNARGFAVVSLDWRSQGASERRARNNRAAHVANFDEYDHDLDMLMSHVAQPLGAPTIALAHSMGAHILLRHLSENKRRFACAVLTAPMLDIYTAERPAWQTHLVTLVFNLRRPSGRLVFGAEERDPLTLAFEDNRVTSDRGRHERTRGMIEAKPFLRISGPSFGWLRAAFRSMHRVRGKRFAGEIVTPLLVFGAGKDRIVKTEAIREYVKLLPNVRYVEIADAEHEILMEANSIRAKFWSEFDAFVDKQLAIAHSVSGQRPAV